MKLMLNESQSRIVYMLIIGLVFRRYSLPSFERTAWTLIINLKKTYYMIDKYIWYDYLHL